MLQRGPRRLRPLLEDAGSERGPLRQLRSAAVLLARRRPAVSPAVWSNASRLLRPDPGIESSVLAGHEDGVWGLTYSTFHHRLASCSADGTVRIWDPQNSEPCLSVFNKERGRMSGNGKGLCV